jgi:hypothetical protein
VAIASHLLGTPAGLVNGAIYVLAERNGKVNEVAGEVSRKVGTNPNLPVWDDVPATV